MQLTQTIKLRIIGQYCLLFYALMIFKWFNGMFLYQLQPIFFFTTLDFTTWLVMLTNLHKWLLQDSSRLLLADLIFYILPIVYYLINIKKSRLSFITAVLMLLVNYMYVTIYCSYPSNSLQGHIAWLFFPFLFMAQSLRTFWFLLNGLRYYFLYFFFSAGIWKLVQHGFFYSETMSGILQMQHKSILTDTGKTSVRADIYNWLITQPLISSFLYRAATLSELFFGVGFFTKKYDYFIALIFLLFLVFNIFLMRIGYWEITPFLLTLYYSKLLIPLNNEAGIQPNNKTLITI